MVIEKCPDGKTNCPIEPTLELIGRKWSMNIIRDLFMGKKRFKDFLESNPDLSTKMLSERLKDLETSGMIEKNIVSKSPITVQYALTKKGRGLNKILYEVAAFSLCECPEEIRKRGRSNKEFLAEMRKGLGIK